jgi:hypothetical protein
MKLGYLQDAKTLSPTVDVKTIEPPTTGPSPHLQLGPSSTRDPILGRCTSPTPSTNYFVRRNEFEKTNFIEIKNIIYIYNINENYNTY